jgi:hypothetical protein
LPGLGEKYFQRKKVWTVIAGLRGEDCIAQLCRKKDINKPFLLLLSEGFPGDVKIKELLAEGVLMLLRIDLVTSRS